MKNSFKQFLADTNRRHSFQRKLISLLCVLSILVSTGVSMLLTMPGLTASSDPVVGKGITELVTDDATNNAWMQYFGIDTDSDGKPVFDTEFVGSIWTDKSVVTEYLNYQGDPVATAEDNNMLGVLSAIGSSMAITGRIRTPTDTMFILDLSSSMYKNGNNYVSTNLQNMVTAVNDSIATLLSLNDYNRIGVTVYWGGDDVRQQHGADQKDGMVLLPLGRYVKKSDKSYLSFSTDNNYTVSSNAVLENTNETVSRSYSNLPSVAGTYAQLGVQLAREEFLDIAPEDTYITLDPGGEYEEQIIRQPVFVFMSDGRPTASHSHFDDLYYNDTDADTDKPINTNGMAEWGLNSETYRTSDASDFVFQLTSSYSKLVVGEHYGIEPLFYTLGLGVDKVSMNAMNPMGTITDSEELADQKIITEWWDELIHSNEDEDVSKDSITIPVLWGTGSNSWSFGTIHEVDMTVHKVDVTLRNGSTIQFPSNIEQMDYVDRYFSATNANALSSSFTQIVNEIILKSIYAPTHTVSGRENTSGEVSFVDKVGQYMEVKDVHGIMLGGQLHTGLNFARTLGGAEGAPELGTLGSATEYGMAFWNNIIEQMGLDHVYATIGPEGETFGRNVEVVAMTEEIIRQAWSLGQLHYSVDADGKESWSNYIAWYADSSGLFCGGWDESSQVVPARAAQRIKSYFFQGTVTGTEASTMRTDMMYITVQVREDIITGEQTVVFSVPTSLLPTLKYFVKLDENGDLLSVHLGSVDEDSLFDDQGRITTRPIRLIYEVGLEESITAQTLLDEVDADYLAQNTNPDTGEVYFYSNEWERDTDGNGEVTDIGYGKRNTYSYFEPSIFNDRYYYLEDSYFYTMNSDGSFSLYTSDTNESKPPYEMELYTLHSLYSSNGSAGISMGQYKMDVSDKAIDAAQWKETEDGKFCLYVPAGTPHTLDVSGVNRFGRKKNVNRTETLIYRNVPTLADDEISGVLLASTLGNNGRIAVAPSGQTLIKKLVDEDGAEFFATRDESFYFLLHEGEALTDSEGKTIDYDDGAAVKEALGTNKITLLKLDVAEGESSSDRQMLYGLTEYTWQDGAWHQKSDETPLWDCTYLEYYTLVELTPDARYDPEGITEAPYTFQYGVYPEGETDHTIYAGNQFAPWTINLTKTNGDTEGAQTLPGAVFGLYSLLADDGLKALPEGFTDTDFALSVTYNGQTWYLVEIKTTGDNGVLEFTDLVRESYLLRELQAPPGHFLPDDTGRNQVVSRDEISNPEKPRTLYVTITNTPGTELPSTGGFGTRPYIIVGAALMISAVVLMLVYEISKRKEEGVSS